MKMTASSFADPADIEAFKRCKAQGKSDSECFKVGDNAIGCWGDSTAQGTGPACALHKDLLQEKFGEHWRKKAKHREILIKYREKKVVCLLKDICGKRSRIDLNPDALAAIGLKPPILTTVDWHWLEPASS